MSDAAVPPKTTPARRRPGRQNARAGGQKAYASENDAAMGDVTYAPRYHGTPQTPNKSAAASGSPAPAGPHSSSAHSASNQRNKNKAKAKNHRSNSPEAVHHGRQTPPQHQVPAKPIGVTAYAGATFHASPAPSDLPMPSFLSKTSSESPARAQPKSIAQEPSPPATDTEVPTPFRPSSVPKPHESPLDFMFRAHREEREQQRQGPADHRLHVLGTTSSPSALSPFEARSLPQARRTDPRRSSNGIDSAELDGTPGQPIGPAFSTPYQERIKAAQANSFRGSPKQTPPSNQYQAPPQDPSDALKKFLFSGGASSGSGSAPASYQNAAPHMGPMPPVHNSVPSPARSDGPGQDRPGNIQAMENDLRRILKMDMAPSQSNSERRVFSQ